MTINNFIPTVWSARLMAHLDKAHVYASVVNRDYEGEIKQGGDQVKINQVGEVTIGTYTKNSDITAPETLTDDQKILVIDQQKYFNFQVDDVDNAQTKPKVMDAAMERAAYGLNDVADKFIASLYTGVDAANTIGSDATPTNLTAVTDAYKYLVRLATKLDEASVPTMGRWVVVPPWFHGLLLEDDRFVKSGTQAGDARLITGKVGEAAGFTVYVSNNVPAATGKYKIMGGSTMAISFAEQIIGVEAYRPEKRFGDAVKGLHLYGGKLVLPKAITVLTATNGVA